MIAHTIRCKPSTSPNAIRVEMGVAPLVVEALAQLVTFLQRLHSLPLHRYSYLALTSSQQLAQIGDTLLV